MKEQFKEMLRILIMMGLTMMGKLFSMQVELNVDKLDVHSYWKNNKFERKQLAGVEPCEWNTSAYEYPIDTNYFSNFAKP